jgi:hypothetical protein
MKIVRILVLSGVIGVVLLPNILFGQDGKLVDAAKKEGGKVVVYGSIENDTMDLIAGALKKKTGLETEYWRAAANKVTDRVANESRSGRPLFDVVLTTDATMQIIQKDGFLAKYDSPSARAFPKEVIDPNLGPSYRKTIIGIVYHAGIIKPADAPKSLEDPETAIQGKSRRTRSEPAHDDGAVDGELAQSNGQQRKSGQVYPRSGRNETVAGGIFDSGRRADYHGRDSDRAGFHQERGFLRQERHPFGLR